MKELIMKILFILGIVAILIMIVFGIMRIVPKIVSSLASAGSAISNVTINREDIAVNTNTDELTTGQSFILSWEHTNPKEEGVYAFSYECAADVEFKIVGKNNTQKTIICNTPFTLSDTPISVQLIPILTQKDSLRDIAVSILFTPTGVTVPSTKGEKVLTLRNFNDASQGGNLANNDVTITTDYDSLNEQSGTSTPTRPTTSNKPTTNNPTPSTPITGGITPTYRAPADLAISNVRATGTRVQFTVTNTGGRASGIWSFNYTLPTNPTTTTNSGVQVSLNPGESLGFTLNIGNTNNLTGNLVSIYLNPYGEITESSLANNAGSTTISYSNSGNNSGNGSYNSNDDADLIISSARAGYMSGSRFIEDDEIDADDDAAIQFTVKNNGGKNTGSWRFEVNLPTNGDDSFRSGNQTSLAPGASITFTLEFDNLDAGNNQSIIIEVDSDDDVDEENESNNRKTVRVDIRN